MDIQLQQNQIETAAGYVSRLEDGVILMEFKPKAKVGLEEAVELWRARMTLNPAHGKQLLLVDLRGNPITEDAARSYGSSLEVIAITQAMAFVTGTFISKVLGNLFINFSKPPYPTRLFDTKEKAQVWLNSMQVQQLKHHAG